MRFSRFWKTYFTFNRTERSGIRILLIIIGLLLTGIFLIPYIIPKENTDYSRFDQQIQEFLASADTLPDFEKEEKKYYSNYVGYSPHKKEQHKTSIINGSFDPNGLSIEQWVLMGLSEKQAAVVKNYEAKNGGFRKKEDLKKLFVISEAFYAKIEPFMVIEETTITDSVKLTENNNLMLDLNLATKEQLMEVKGIGDKLSEYILDYKKRLGGYHSVEQLKEVYRMKEENYEFVKSSFFIDPKTVDLQKININYASFKEIIRHPYFDYDLTQKVVDYRQRNGFFKDVSELKTSGLVDEQLYSKLAPYIRVK